MTLSDLKTEVTESVRWTWLGPVLLGLILMMSGAWAVNITREVSNLKEAVVMLIQARGETNGKLDAIILQNSTQDGRLTLISQRIDLFLTNMMQQQPQKGIR